MSEPIDHPAGSLQRRSLLKGTAGILATGVFPAIHAADPITLRYLGTAVNQDKAIAEKVKADTERDYFMTADEAREYGLVDQVIAKRP